MVQADAVPSFVESALTTVVVLSPTLICNENPPAASAVTSPSLLPVHAAESKSDTVEPAGAVPEIAGVLLLAGEAGVEEVKTGTSGEDGVVGVEPSGLSIGVEPSVVLLGVSGEVLLERGDVSGEHAKRTKSKKTQALLSKTLLMKLSLTSLAVAALMAIVCI